jgi:Transposase DDE domain
MSPTTRYCPSCCTGKRPGCGAITYRGQRAVIREHAPKARDFTNRRYRHRGVVDEVERAKNRTKSKVRAKVEHSIGVIKRVFGFAKVRYRGLKKKHAPPAGDLRAGQSINRAPPPAALSTGVVCPLSVQQPCTPPNTAPTRPQLPCTVASERIAIPHINAPTPCSDPTSAVSI